MLSLFTWLAILKKVYGVCSDESAIFCNLTQGQRGKHLVKESFRKMLVSFLKKSGLDGKGFRTHSCRRTAAYYAAWQGIPEATIKLYGRWQSTVYLSYVEAADKDHREWEEMREIGEKNPIQENMDIYGHFV